MVKRQKKTNEYTILYTTTKKRTTILVLWISLVQIKTHESMTTLLLATVVARPGEIGLHTSVAVSPSQSNSSVIRIQEAQLHRGPEMLKYRSSLNLFPMTKKRKSISYIIKYFSNYMYYFWNIYSTLLPFYYILLFFVIIIFFI